MSLAHHRSAVLFLNHRYRGPLLAPLRLVLRLALMARYQILRRTLPTALG